MASRSFALDDVLAVAHVHPFYSDTEYPATRESLPDVLAAAKSQKDRARGLKDFPLTRKESLYVQNPMPPTHPQ